MMQQSRKPWTIYQDNSVIEIIKQIGTKNWPLVSQIMKQKYHIEERSGKQCRQRWHNQLNPQVNKLPWTDQEEKLLFEAHKIHKNKWIEISKLFIGRTDNSVKNHFYSTIRRSLRRICKLLGNKNSTSELRNIKPSILSKIFQFSQFKEDQLTSENLNIVNQSKIITQQLLQFARNKFHYNQNELEQGKRKNLQYLISKLNQFSKNYQQKNNIFSSYLKDDSFIFSQKSISKNNNIIILQSNSKSSKLISQNNQQQSPYTTYNHINNNIKKLSTMSTKQYIYDWQQFQKRCNRVKQIFQKNNISNKERHSYSYSHSIKDQNYDTEKNNFNQPNTGFCFFDQYVGKEQGNNKQNQKNKKKIYGFQPYQMKQ